VSVSTNRRLPLWCPAIYEARAAGDHKHAEEYTGDNPGDFGSVEKAFETCQAFKGIGWRRLERDIHLKVHDARQ
jgi:hypothetical protein